MVHDTVPIVPEAGSSPVVLVVSFAAVLLVELELLEPLSVVLLLELLDTLLVVLPLELLSSVVLVVSALTAITFVAATLLTAVSSVDEDEALVGVVVAAWVANAGTIILSGALPPKIKPTLKIINFEIRQRTRSPPIWTLVVSPLIHVILNADSVHIYCHSMPPLIIKLIVIVP